MKCPIDTTVELVMTDRQGIEIDYCFTCRGVWLDRGELDKLIERASATLPRPATAGFAAPQPSPSPNPGERPYRDGDRDWQRTHPQGKPRKKRSFLGDMFDF